MDYPGVFVLANFIDKNYSETAGLGFVDWFNLSCKSLIVSCICLTASFSSVNLLNKNSFSQAPLAAPTTQSS